MSIDINQEVKVWGGFSPTEFWLGAGGILGSAVIGMLIGTRTTSQVGAIVFLILAGSIFGFMVYQRDLPKGYIKRRFEQEGKFLFIKIPGIQGTDVYSTPFSERGKRFAEAYGEVNGSDENEG